MINNALIGFGIFLFFVTYLCFKLDEKHQALKFFLISICIFVLPTLTIMADDCNFINTNTTITNTTQINYYEYTCSSERGKLLVKPIYFIQIFYILYVFLYILWVLLTKYTDVEKIMNEKLKRKKW
jgi:hypothetical protein